MQNHNAIQKTYCLCEARNAVEKDYRSKEASANNASISRIRQYQIQPRKPPLKGRSKRLITGVGSSIERSARKAAYREPAKTQRYTLP